MKDLPLPADATSTQILHSSPSPRECVHEVFLSFRGEDTRHTFTEDLYTALEKKRINTFRDDENLERGKAIAPELLKAIEESRFAIIILSENYASSTWCLDELAHIVECNKDKDRGLVFFPVFYHVDPSEVRKQLTGNFGKALAKHEEAFKNEKGRVDRWREALKEVANVSGWHLRDRDKEAKAIKIITGKIQDLLITKDLIGIDSRVKEVESILDLKSSDDIRTIHLWGMGGVGKTTLAQEVFKKIRNQFECSHFVHRVREEARKHGLVSLQKDLYENLLDSDRDHIQDVEMGIDSLRKRVRFKKMLIVLDDVSDLEQITALANGSWLGKGSRVIITTRDKTLSNCQVPDHKIYEVKKLTHGEALQLFCRKAFNKSHAPDDHYEELSIRFVEYAGRLPLALKVLGSYLNGEKDWPEALAKLKEHPDKGIDGVLQVSYSGLEDTHKNIFLDIACFFKGEDQDRVKRILASCGFYPNNGILDLIDKSLITVENNKLRMHDLLQQMGRKIVYNESPKEPGKRSRLWVNEDVRYTQWHDDVLTENNGTNSVEGIFLSLPAKEEIELDADPFSKMRKLRLLKLCNVNFSECPEYFSKHLRLLEWHEYPLKSLPSTFKPHLLVELNMPNSCLEQLWNETVPSMENLVKIDLSNSQHLTKISDFSKVPNLEGLILQGCEKLLELHPTVGNLPRLRLLNLKGCETLESLPHSISLESLEAFILSGCSKLKAFPDIVGNMKDLSELYLEGTEIRELPISIQQLEGLVVLDLRGCKNLLSLPSVLCSLTSLEYLLLSGSSHVDQLPENIGSLEHLEVLDACDTGIRKVPASIVLLKKLKYLCFHGCKDQQSALQLPNSFSGLSSLTTLNLSQCGLEEGAIPADIGFCLPSLQSLNLSGNNFVSLPESISQISELRQLGLIRCSKLQSLPKNLPTKLTSVEARDCPMLKNYSSTLTIWASDKGFCFTNCGKSDESEDSLRRHALPLPEDHIGALFPKFIEERIHNEERFELRFPHAPRIPEWCSHYSSGASVTVPLDDLQDINSRWIGIALFVVFEILEKDNFDKSWEVRETLCHYETNNGSLGSPLVFHNFIGFRSRLSYGLCFYQPLGGRFSGLLSESSTLLTCSISTLRPDLQLRGCGIHLISHQNVARFIHSFTETANQHLDLNIGQHCKRILDRATELESSGDVMELGYDLQELGSTSSALNQGSYSTDSSANIRQQPKSELESLFSVFFKDVDNFHFSFPCALILPWFFNQYLGDVSLCHIPQNLFQDEEWMGLELYVVLTWRPSILRPESLRCSFLLVDLCSPDQSSIMHRSIKIHSYLQSDEQLLVLHIPRVCFPQHELNQWPRISVFFGSSTQDVEVRWCGSRLLYEKDLNKLIEELATACTLLEPQVLSHQLYLPIRLYVDKMVDNPLCEAESTVECPTGVLLDEESRLQMEFWNDQLINASPKQISEQVSSSRVHKYKCYLEQKQGFIGSDAIAVHSKRSLLEYRDSNIQQNVAEEDLAASPQACHHLHVIAETQLYGSCNLAEWKSYLEFLLQYAKVSTLSLKGNTISVWKHFSPSSTYNFCFPQKHILEWFKDHSGMSSRVGIQLPPKLCDNIDWRGLVICAAFSVHELPTADLENLGSEMIVKLLCHLRTKDYCLNPFPICSTTKEKFKWLHLRGFIWLTYIPRVLLSEFSVISDIVEARIYSNCPGLSVKNCGIRLLYRQEVKELKQAITHCWTSFFDNSDLIRQFVESNENFQPSHPDHVGESYTEMDDKGRTRPEIPMFEGHMKDFDRNSIYNTRVPHCSESLEWFRHQSSGPSVTIQSLQSQCHENWTGLALCAYFSSQEKLDPEIAHYLICHLRTENSSLEPLHQYQIPNEDSKWLQDGGFIWLSYLPRQWFQDQLNECNLLEASFASDSRGVLVPKCGLRLIYQHDVEEFKQHCIHTKLFLHGDSRFSGTESSIQDPCHERLEGTDDPKLKEKDKRVVEDPVASPTWLLEVNKNTLLRYEKETRL